MARQVARWMTHRMTLQIARQMAYLMARPMTLRTARLMASGWRGPARQPRTAPHARILVAS